ncbi:MAG: hypothetical protein ABUL44_01810 [Flavobacterium sp.]
MLDGVWKKYDENGVLILESVYQSGVEVKTDGQKTPPGTERSSN